MDSVAMSHLTHPPMVPISPLPNPRDQNCRLSSQNLTMFAESARINKVKYTSELCYIKYIIINYHYYHQELFDLQRRISSLNVNETSQAMKRDRLAFELRYSNETINDNVKAV